VTTDVSNAHVLKIFQNRRGVLVFEAGDESNPAMAQPFEKTGLTSSA